MNLNDARHAALEAQGFTGALPEMTLQWLQANGATSDQLSDAWLEMLNEQYLGGAPQQPNLHVNPSLVGGGVSGPGVGSFPPDGYTIGFNTVTSGPHQDGWITNPDEDTGRAYLAYSIQDNNPDLVVGHTYAYRMRVTNTSTTGSPITITVTGDANITVEAITDRVPLGQTTWLHINITIDAAGYTGQIRVGTGVTSNRTERYVIQRGATFRDTEELPDVREMPGQRNDLWYAHLGDLGYVGNINDRELAFWLDGGLFYPPLPESQWTIGQSGDDYGYGPGYGGLDPDGTVDLTVLILSADAGSNLVTMAFSGPVLYQGITVAAEGIGVTNLLPVADDTYNAVDPAFTAAVVAALGTTVPVAVLPTGAVIPPRWSSNIPNGRVYLTDTYTYNVSRHIGHHPYFPVTDYALDPDDVAGASINENGVFRLTGEPEDDYSFQVIATNLVGDSPSNTFTIEVYRLPPQIDTPPDDVTVLEPEPATFTVAASHPRGADLFYQWQTDVTGAWAPVADAWPGRVIGEDTESFTLDPTEFDDASSVRCRIRAYEDLDELQIFTPGAQLAVNRFIPPDIDTHPQDLPVTAPDGGNFWVVASHPDDAPLFYLWQAWDGGNWVNANTVLNTGPITASLMSIISTELADDNTAVRCRVRAYSATDPNYQSFSDPGVLHVNDEERVPPVIDAQPDPVDVQAPNPAVFRVTASHPEGADLFYTWEAEVLLGGGAYAPAVGVFGGRTTGHNTSEMTLTTTQATDSRNIRCLVRAYSAESSDLVYSTPAALTVTEAERAPNIEQQPRSLAVVEGDGGQISVSATHANGVAPLWQVPGLNTPGSWFAADHASEGLSDVSGARTQILTVNTAELTDNRPVRVTCYAGEIGSDLFTVSLAVALKVVAESPAATWGLVPAMLFNPEENPQTVDMNAYVLQGLDLENWQLHDAPPGVTIDQEGIVTIDRATIGPFTMTCSVENIFGSDTSNPIAWAIAGPPTITTQPVAMEMTVPGGAQNLTEATHPDPEVPLFPVWEVFDPTEEVWLEMHQYYSHVNRVWLWDVSIDSTNEADAALEAGYGRCRVYAYARFGSIYTDTDHFDITIDLEDTPPTIDQQPVDLTVTEPDPASFSVEATPPSGSGIAYQWFARAEGETEWIDPTLVFSDIDEASVFTSTLVIPTTSVTEPPPPPDAPVITTQPGNAEVSEPTGTTFTVEATGDLLEYAWEGNTGSGWGDAATVFSNVDAADQQTLRLITTAQADTGQVRVTVFNESGSEQSAEATLTVNEPGAGGIIFETNFGNDVVDGYNMITGRDASTPKPWGWDQARGNEPNDFRWGGFLGLVADEGEGGSNALLWRPGADESSPTNHIYCWLGKHLTNDKHQGFRELWVRYRFRFRPNGRISFGERVSMWKWARVWQNTPTHASGHSQSGNRLDAYQIIPGCAGDIHAGALRFNSVNASGFKQDTRAWDSANAYSKTRYMAGPGPNDHWARANARHTLGYFERIGLGNGVYSPTTPDDNGWGNWPPEWDRHDPDNPFGYMLNRDNPEMFDDFHTVTIHIKLADTGEPGDESGYMEFLIDDEPQGNPFDTRQEWDGCREDQRDNVIGQCTPLKGSGINYWTYYDNFAELSKAWKPGGDWNENVGDQGGMIVNDIVISSAPIPPGYVAGNTDNVATGTLPGNVHTADDWMLTGSVMKEVPAALGLIPPSASYPAPWTFVTFQCSWLTPDDSQTTHVWEFQHNGEGPWVPLDSVYQLSVNRLRYHAEAEIVLTRNQQITAAHIGKFRCRVSYPGEPDLISEGEFVFDE